MPVLPICLVYCGKFKTTLICAEERSTVQMGVESEGGGCGTDVEVQVWDHNQWLTLFQVYLLLSNGYSFAECKHDKK